VPDRRCLVTGAGGFVGARLVARLAARGDEVHALVRPGGSRPRGDAVRVLEGDVADPASRERVADLAPDLVFHLAVRRAVATPADRLEATRVNVLGTATMLEAAAAGHAERFVHFGGALEYAPSEAAMGDDAPLAPHGHYGATKAAASLLCAARSDVETVVLRPFHVYGPGQPEDRLIPTLLRAAREGSSVTLVDGPAHDWVHVDDVVEAALAAVDARLPSGAVVNVGTGRQWSNEEVLDAVERVTGRRVEAMRGGEPRPWDRVAWRAYPERLRSLGIEPRGLEEGLAQTWAQIA
jgi:nucleoside-diphosphate-sugar epimerase